MRPSLGFLDSDLIVTFNPSPAAPKSSLYHRRPLCDAGPVPCLLQPFHLPLLPRNHLPAITTTTCNAAVQILGDPLAAYNQGPPAQSSPSLTTNSHATLRLSTNTMAATVAPSQAIPPGLHPLQAAALRAAANAQQQQAQQPQQPPQRTFDDEPFDVTSRKLTLRDFVRVRTLGTGTSLVSRDLASTRPYACRLFLTFVFRHLRPCLSCPPVPRHRSRSQQGLCAKDTPQDRG